MKNLFGAGLLALALAATSTVASAAPACAIGTNLIGLPSPNNATDVAPGITASSGSQSCSINSLTFSNFSYTLSPTTGFENAPFQILINSLPPSSSIVQLGFNPDTAPNSDLQLEFQVTGNSITGVQLSYNGTTGNINEEVCNVFMPTGVCATGIGVGGVASLGVSPLAQNAQLMFATAQSSVWIFKDIAAGAGFFSEVNQGFIVPEPMTFSLLGAGLLGLGLMGRRRASK